MFHRVARRSTRVREGISVWAISPAGFGCDKAEVRHWGVILWLVVGCIVLQPCSAYLGVWHFALCQMGPHLLEQIFFAY
eukprot:13144406-Ditylum_brightwellii.AAC.2